jgi:single-strand DNA-binding protein
MNVVVLIGRLTRDPELKYTTSGTAVCNFSLAVDKRKKEDGADFFDCVAWQKTAELIAQYLGKGRKCGIQGRLQARQYEAADGSKRKVTEVVVESIEFLDKPKEATGDPMAETAIRFNDEDLVPF